MALFLKKNARLVNLKRLAMFKLFQEVSDLGLQRSGLTFCVASLDFVTDEVPEQTVVSPFFIRRLKVFCPHVVAHCCCPQPRIEMALNYHAE
jgi:hypothetical protein